MPTVRLFAQLKDVVGASRTEIPASSLNEALHRLVDQYGPGFGEMLAQCVVWVNGEPADSATMLGESDELAILPPVSGGME